MTGRAVLLLACVFALLLGGLAARNGGVIALALPLVAYLGLGLLRSPPEIALRAERTLSATRVAPGKAAQVTLIVWNEGAPVDELSLTDRAGIGLAVDGAARAFCRLDAGGRAELAYSVTGGRGEHVFSGVEALCGDGHGLFERRLMLASPARLAIEPDAQPMRRVPIRPPRTRGFAGPILSRQPGAGIDFLGVREYQPGDRLRWVNWRTTARCVDELFTNLYEQERVADVGLIVDAREQVDVRAGGVRLFEHSVRAAASLSDAWLSEGNRLGLVIYGSGVESVFPGYGRAQKVRVLQALGRAVPGHNYALENLDRLPTRFFPAGSQIVFISPLARGDVPVLIRLRAHGYAVMLISPDPVAYEAAELRDRTPKPDPGAGIGAKRGLEIAIRMAEIERRLALQRLSRFGVQVVDWRVGDPLDYAVRKGLARYLKPIASRRAAGSGGFRT